MLSSMFLPRNIPENIEEDVILKQVLQIKSEEVENLFTKISNAQTLPMTEIKEFLSKIDKN